MVRCALISILAVCLLSPVQAKVSHDLSDIHLAAKVNGEGFPINAVNDLFEMVKHKQPELNKKSFMQGLIENQLFAEYAIKEVGIENLMQGSKVGFSRDVAIENKFIAHLRTLFHKQITQALEVLPSKDVSSYIDAEYPYKNNHAELQKALEMTGFLEHKMTADQVKTAKNIELMKYKFPGEADKSISLWDIYRRQNIQGRVRMHRMDIGFIQVAVQQRFIGLYVLHWTPLYSGYTEKDVAALYKIVRDKNIKEHYLPTLGVFVDIHDDNERLAVLAKKVSKKQIKIFYEDHQDKFRIVDRVRARHIRCKRQAECLAAYEAVEKGKSFKNAVIQYSTAYSKEGATPGDLGWIKRETQHLPWLQTLALIQKEGLMTRPIRSPQIGEAEVNWEIILVDKRIETVLALESKTVAYTARQELAKEMAVEEFNTLKKKLFSGADIHLNMSALSTQ